MITLYGFGKVHRQVCGLTRDLRAAWALEESGLPYQVRGLDHFAGELDSEEFVRISPFHQVPILEDDGFVVAESGAILLYLAEKSGKLMPSDAQGRARVTQWCFAALATIEPPLFQKVMLGDKPGPDYLPGWISRVLQGTERQLEGRDWICCDQFTVADVLLTTVLREIRKTDLLSDYPRLSGYLARCQARPAWQRALSKHAERLGVPLEELR